MANGNGLSLEGVHRELENLGSLVRSLSTQIASVRVRVSDLEHWDVGRGQGELRLLGKDVKKGKGKGKGKGKEKQPGQPPSPPPGKQPGKQPGKLPGKGKGYGR